MATAKVLLPLYTETNGEKTQIGMIEVELTCEAVLGKVRLA